MKYELKKEHSIPCKEGCRIIKIKGKCNTGRKCGGCWALCKTCISFNECHTPPSIVLIERINAVFRAIRLGSKTKTTIPAIKLPKLPWRW